MLLFLTQKGFLLFNVVFKGFLSDVCFVLLHLLTGQLKQLSLLVPLAEGQFACLVLEFHQFTRVSGFLAGFGTHTLMQLLNFELVLFLQLFQT